MPNVTLAEPLDYLPFVHLMQRSHMILTDSGGIEAERAGSGSRWGLRQVTEGPEAVEASTVQLVRTEPAHIVAAACRLLEDRDVYAHVAQVIPTEMATRRHASRRRCSARPW